MFKEWLKEYKWYVALGALLLIIILFAFLSGANNEVIEPIYAETNDDEESEEVEIEDEDVPDTVFIEVKGAVEHPGVLELPADARVTNVLEMAQVLSTADLTPVNQSQKVSDEMVVYVPEEGEEMDLNYISNGEDSQESTEDVVNINTATVNDFMTLNGIGEKKAALIVEYRETNGLFMKIEDLMNISGIGEKTFDSLEPYITID